MIDYLEKEKLLMNIRIKITEGSNQVETQREDDSWCVFAPE